MRVIQWLAFVLLLVLGLLVALLALGTFAGLSSTSPLWLRSLGSLEQAAGLQLGTFGLPAFLRGVVLSVAASALLGLMAFAKPRA